MMLFFKIRATLKEKLKKFFLDFKTKMIKAKEVDTVVERILRLILLNAFVNLICKIPMSIVSVNDLRILIRHKFAAEYKNNFERRMFEFPYSMKVFCHLDDACLIFLDFSNFLFFFAASFGFFFYKSFDIKFKSSFSVFKTAFLKKFKRC